MAVKHSLTKHYEQDVQTICKVLRDPRFTRLQEFMLKTETKTETGVDFHFIHLPEYSRYGRNFFVQVSAGANGGVDICVVTQSRKVTVLFDPMWKTWVSKVFSALDVMLDFAGAAQA